MHCFLSDLSISSFERQVMDSKWSVKHIHKKTKPNDGFVFTVTDYHGLWWLFSVLNKNGWLQMDSSEGRKMSSKCKGGGEAIYTIEIRVQHRPNILVRPRLSLIHFILTAN